MFDAAIEQLVEDRLSRYQLSRNGLPITYSELLDLLEKSQEFRSFFSTLLAESPFEAYRWETPPLTCLTADRPFEFVLFKARRFASRQSDAAAYQEYFTDDDVQQGIVTFPNLRGDSTLIVPSPRTDHSAYGHLAAFIRQAPESQVDMLWQVVGTTVNSKIDEQPLWLSTAGGGVAWLHIRIDSRPKYYGYTPYKQVS